MIEFALVRRSLASLVAIALAPVLFVAVRTTAYANGPTGKRPTPEAVHAAQTHMAKARQLYEVGNYPDAIVELETARALDPYAKDLVFNLGIVHEKALHIEEALHFYRLFLDMDLTAEERAHAEAIVKRLEGARAHVQPTSSASGEPTASVTATTTSSAPPHPPGHGRIDGWTVTSGILTLGGFGVGIGFGVLALATRPPDGTVTGSMLTYAQLQSEVDTAHTYAIVADIGFATGIVFTAVTLGLFFGRTKKPDVYQPQVMVVPSPMGLGIAGTF